MRESILAGLMIAIGAALFLILSGPLGAFFFSIGLLTILYFKFSLFTGKAGLLGSREIKPWKLLQIYFGNLLGCTLGVVLLRLAGLGSKLLDPATAIINIRIGNLWFENIALGIICGLLMYIAVNQYNKAPYVTIMCVMGFILMGANHCIADMVYILIAITAENWYPTVMALVYTTIGNIIGCNLIAVTQSQKQSGSSSSSS